MLEHLKNATNFAHTENGALAHRTTKSDVLDFFATGGAMRQRDEQSIIRAFTKAFSEDALLALKALFYFRDIRGGQGERRLFRVIVRYMGMNQPYADVLKKNLHLFEEYGRWDDIYALFDTRLEQDVLTLIKENWDKPSLMAKWLHSINFPSLKKGKDGVKHKRNLTPEKRQKIAYAKRTAKYLGLSEEQYRKALAKKRSAINLLETLMSQNRWEEIQFDKLPSKAGLQYREAFKRHTPERYQAFLDSLKKGEKKINASTLYPYELVLKAFQRNDVTVDEMWKALPDYMGDNAVNGMVVADVSGSMTATSYHSSIRPLDVSISLAMYMAERNKSAVYKDHFMTFSNRPQLVKIQGKTLHEKVTNMYRAHWEMNTNVKAVFDMILNTAKKHNIPQNEMIGVIFIVSDMEFDSADRGASKSKTLFQTIRSEYHAAGYEMPKLVFWNVNARNDQFPVTMTDNGVQLVSGASPSIFRNLLAGTNLSAYDLMLEVLNADRYAQVTV